MSVELQRLLYVPLADPPPILFLDCTKSRQKPVSDLEIGFHASLPALLAVMAIREGRSFKWDDGAEGGPWCS